MKVIVAIIMVIVMIVLITSDHSNNCRAHDGKTQCRNLRTRGNNVT